MFCEVFYHHVPIKLWALHEIRKKRAAACRWEGLSTYFDNVWVIVFQIFIDFQSTLSNLPSPSLCVITYQPVCICPHESSKTVLDGADCVTFAARWLFSGCTFILWKRTCCDLSWIYGMVKKNYERTCHLHPSVCKYRLCFYWFYLPSMRWSRTGRGSLSWLFKGLKLITRNCLGLSGKSSEHHIETMNRFWRNNLSSN